MIDLEASSSVPVLLELVLLIDDTPLLDLSDDGFRERLDIAPMYLNEFSRRHTCPWTSTSPTSTRCSLSMSRLEACRRAARADDARTQASCGER